MRANTLFLRLEGALQAWGDQQSKFVIRRTAEAPTKSGVIGMLCGALGVPRSEAPEKWLPTLGALRMGVRMDRPGIRWWDYHTIGAGMQMRTAEGKEKPGAMLTRREYLCDASFLVSLQGEPDLIRDLEAAVRAPVWAPYLGRRCCPPSRPLLEQAAGEYPDLYSAIKAVPWRRRLNTDPLPASIACLLDWEPTPEQPEAPDDALIWYDVPLTLEPPSHRPRFVVRRELSVGELADVSVGEEPMQRDTPRPPRLRANYQAAEYRKRRQERLEHDSHLCVFCKAPAHTVQHVTYRHAGGRERLDELRSLCQLCHDAVTMLEYGLNMGLDRINPEDPRWRPDIISKRRDIIEFRSLETRRRRLSAEEVE